MLAVPRDSKPTIVTEGQHELLVRCPNCLRPVSLGFTVSARQTVDDWQVSTLRVRLAARGRVHHCEILDPAQLALIERSEASA